MTARWNARWPNCRPIGHELRSCAQERWVRFHSLPESKRYAESEFERSEILRRHNTVIDQLISGVDDNLVVVTCAWSSSSLPVERWELEQSASSDAVYWQSVLREVDHDGEFWNHLYVDVIEWSPGVLDDLLLVVAEGETSDAFVASTDFEWLYHPYDGGADVIAPSGSERDRLRDKYNGWLSSHPQGL